jgi:uncharacterized membrane protein YoaK (UPF0700 family)
MSGPNGRPGQGQFVRRMSTMEVMKSVEAVLGGFKRPSCWMLVFGNILAVSAGIVNGISIRVLGCMVSNMTGNWSNAAIRLEGVTIRSDHLYTYSHVDVVESLMFVVCFVTGAFICGLLIDKNQLRFGGKSWYGAALIGVCFLLILAATPPKDNRGIPTAGYPAAMGMGLQNAMCTSHFGAVVRTTHVTGTVTDMGSTMGRIAMIILRRRWRGQPLNAIDKAEIEVDRRKLMVLLPIFISFGFGCYIGAICSGYLQQNAYYIPAALSGVIGCLYTFQRERLKRYLKKLHKDNVDDELADNIDEATDAGDVLDSIDESDESEDDSDECQAHGRSAV